MFNLFAFGADSNNSSSNSKIQNIKNSKGIKSNINQKKSQVTIFIIIGIVILILVVVASVYLSNLKGKTIFGNKDRDSVVIYTESCIEQTARQGAFILSTSGGYIDIPDRYVEQGAYIDMGGRIPYWYYKGFERVPSRTNMKEDLQKFIDTNMNTCLNDFADFKDKFNVTFQSNPESEVIITDTKIYVNTNLHLTINDNNQNDKNSGSNLDIREFSVEFDSSLGKNYELAKKLMEYENEDNYLEYYTDEMIAASDYLPYEGAFLTCSPYIWTEKDLEIYTKELVMHNLNFIMFEGTSYKETGMPYYDKLYKVPIFEKRNKNYKDTVVKVIYSPNWQTNFKVSPSKSGIVKSFEMKLGDIIPLCMQVMHHKYTMDYPVVFQIIDKEHPEEPPFLFSTPVMMKNSQPNRKNEAKEFIKIKEDFSEDEYCQEKLEYTYFRRDEFGLTHLEKSRYTGMKNSLDIYAIDMLKGFPNGILAGANISYQCVDFRCNLGPTKYPLSEEGLYAGEMPLYAGKVPDCMNGMFIAEKDGYYRGITQYSVGEETNGDQVNIELYPLKNVMYGITVIENHNGVINERGLVEGEKVIISLRNMNLTEFEETVIIPSNIGYYKDLKLPMGEDDMNYALDIKLVKNNVYLGGLEMNWTLTTEQLYSSSFITFFVIKKDPVVPPSTPEEWEEVMNYAIQNSPNYPPDIS